MFTAFNPRWHRNKSASRSTASISTRKPRAPTKVDVKPALSKTQRPKKVQDIPLQDLSHLRSAAHGDIATNGIAPRPPPLSGSSSSTGRPSSRSSSTASMITAKTHLSEHSETAGGGTDVIDFANLEQVSRGWYRSRGLPVPSVGVLTSREKIVEYVNYATRNKRTGQRSQERNGRRGRSTQDQ